MTTSFQVVDGDRGESRSEASARRLRGELAQRRISISEVARRVGMTQGALSRRMTGHVEFTLDLIDQICSSTGISFAFITTGIKETPAGPDGPDGGSECPQQGSNLRPADYKTVTSLDSFRHKGAAA